MKRFHSIKENNDFQVVYRTGRSYASKLLVMYVIRRGEQEVRIGISVSRKARNSVIRYRVIKLIRESFRLNRAEAETGLDIAVVARPAARDSDCKMTESAFAHLCRLYNIKKELK